MGQRFVTVYTSRHSLRLVTKPGLRLSQSIRLVTVTVYFCYKTWSTVRLVTKPRVRFVTAPGLRLSQSMSLRKTWSTSCHKT